MYITASVGQNGKNKRTEVAFIQTLLALLSEEDMRMPAIATDGLCGKNTIAAIGKFQKLYVKLQAPDYRIDPNGRSEKTLVAKSLEIDKCYLEEIAKKYALKKVNGAVHQKGPRTITYRANAKQVLSPYSENVIKLAMTYGGVGRCDISSTIRTFNDQARIMHDNCAAYPNAKSVDALRTARGWGYALPGRAVEEVYFNNTDKSRDETIAAMKDKVESLYKDGKKVSLHCVSEADYKKKNIVDIPYSSVLASGRKSFEIALMGMTQEIKNARYAMPLKGEIYISRLIVEDRCWHIEVDQLNKPLPNQNKNAALTNCGPKQGGRRCVAQPPAKTSGSSFLAFLDHWF